MARTMLNESNLNEKIWGQAVHTTIHIIKKGLLKIKGDKNHYELWIGRMENVRQFKIFGSRCYIKR